MDIKLSLRKTLALLVVVFEASICFGQIKNPFDIRYNNLGAPLQGEITMIANNIVNRRTNSNGPNVPYNVVLGDDPGPTANDNFNMQYIDIDGDNSTFNSSSANLFVKDVNCSQIVYAGLYWGATYKYNTGNDPASGRFEDWNQIKFKVPGGSYANIIATEVLYNGFTESSIESAVAHSPYACYANVTNLLNTLSNPNGTYTVGNIRASKDGRGSLDGENVNPFRIRGGVSGGWSLVVVYRNITFPSKNITTFDGYGIIQSGNQNDPPITLDIIVDGFQSLPAPRPVKAKMGVAALEGDNSISGDQLFVKALTSPVTVPPKALFNNPLFTNTTAENTTNFFNSSITLPSELPTPLSQINSFFITRLPASRNTLGWDSHLLPIKNDGNIIIPNDETQVTLTATSTGDKYDIFLTTFDIEVIEPKIRIIKTVGSAPGTANDLNGATLALGQEFYYNINFKNIGNDNAENFVITDILPTNIVFPIGGTINPLLDLVLPPGVTYNFNSATKTFRFFVANNLVTKNSSFDFTISIRVRAPFDCNDIVDSCQNIIRNQAFGNYNGEFNAGPFSDIASYSNGNICRDAQPAPTNYLIDIEDCNYTSTEILCENTLELNGPDGYTTYSWTNSNGVVIGTSQNVTVSAAGVYTLTVTIPNPCSSFLITVTVINFVNAITTHPVTSAFYDEVVTCPNNGIRLPKIILCGIDDHRLIQTGITNATSIIWEKFTEGSCPTTLINQCPNTSTNTSCNWTQVATGADYDATIEGQYRITIIYEGGCFRTFYFNVYKNLLNPIVTTTDIVCTTLGSIKITNLPNGYLYSLNVNGPFLPISEFPINAAGNYTVYIVQSGVIGGCKFEYPVNILSKPFSVDVEKTDKLCNNGFGSISVQIDNVDPQYYFQLSQGATILTTIGPLTVNNYTFNNLNPGTYSVKAYTDDGCEEVRSITIANLANLTLSAQVIQNISCTPGIISVTSSGGLAPVGFAIYSYNNVLVDPASYEYQSNILFPIPIGKQGIYQFIVVDANNCINISAPVTIVVDPTPILTATPTNVSCNGLNNGSISVSSNISAGYVITYSINGVDFQSSQVFSPLAPGAYTISVKFNKNENECIYTTTAAISQPTVLIGASQLVQNKTCVITSGTIQAINVSGGTAPYLYSINGTFNPSNTNPVFANLAAGTYTITIRDANLCTFVALPQTITNPILPILSVANLPALCPSLTTTINASVTAGNTPFTFQIIAPSIINPTTTTATSGAFAGLATGSYTVRVTDSKGCTDQETIFINPVTQISIIGNATNVICFGTNSGAASYMVSGFSGTYSYTLNNGTAVVNQTSPNIALNNLAAGTYRVDVTDNLTNCTAFKIVTVVAPPSALTLLYPFTPKTCLANGSLNASASGGWGSPQFTLTYPDLTTVIGPQLSGVFTNLSQTGSYIIKVLDANGCEVSNTFPINATSNPDLNIVPGSSTLCISGSAGASITVFASSGSGSYQYQINGGALQNDPVFNNLIAGTYTIKVIDSFGCEDSVTQIIYPQLTAPASITKALDCSTLPDATITVNVNGGLAPYQYQVKFNTDAFGPLTAFFGSSFAYFTTIAGLYQFQITDAAGCAVLSNGVNVAPVSNPNITAVTQTQQILCFGNTTGAFTATIDPALGTGPFQYSIDGITFQNDNFFSAQAAGTYTIIVRDFNQCTDTDTITIGQPDPIGFTLTKIDITCSGAPGVGNTPGSITVSGVTGGTQPYQYILRNVTFNVIATSPSTILDYTFNAPDVDFGIYNVEVIDANGCSSIQTVTIASPPNSLIATNATSNCLTGGTVEVTVLAIVTGSNYEFGILTSATAPYATSFQGPDTPGGTVSTFTGLVPGFSYTFVVHDLTSNCYFIQNIPTPIPPSSSVVATLGIIQNIGCTGSTDGNVSFSITNFSTTPIPTTSVTYEIFESLTNISTGLIGNSAVSGPTDVIAVTNFGTLGYGQYYILITENGGCTTASATFNILESTKLLEVQATLVQNDNCTTDGGIISALGQFGTAPYTFMIAPNTAVAPTVATWTGTSTSTFAVETGNYIVYIKDANNCIQESTVIFVPVDTAPSISLSLVNPCVNEGLFEITVTRTNGVSPFTYTVDGGAAFTQNASSFTISNLTSGVHTVIVIDANGCRFEPFVSITIPQNLSGSIIKTQPSCANNDGAIDADAINGSGSYLYVLQDAFGVPIGLANTDGVFTNLGFGSYTVVVTDADPLVACTIPLDVSLGEPADVTLLPTIFINPKCNGDFNGSITVNLDAGNINTPYTYVLTAAGFTTVTQIGNGIFTGLAENAYTVTVTSERGCVANDAVPLVAPSLLTIDANAPAFSCVSGTNNTNVVTISITQPTVGGTAPYLYSFNGSNYSDETTFDVIDTGLQQTITAFVKDFNGCIASDAVIIDPLVKITSLDVAKIDALSCASSENISITINGGVGPFNYQLLPSTTSINVVGNIIFTSLNASGSYVYQINDTGTGCSLTTTHDIQTLQNFSVTATGSTLACFGATNGTLNFNVSGYSGPFTFNVLREDGSVFSSGTNTSIVPINGLSVGNYSVVVTIPNTNAFVSCTETSNVIGISAPANDLDLQISQTSDVTCENNSGTIQANGSGGTVPYQYQLESMPSGTILVGFGTQIATSFANLTAGDYRVKIKDFNNCEKSELLTLLPTIPITVLNPPTIANQIVPCYSNSNASVTITGVSGGQGTYQYELTNLDTNESVGPLPTSTFSNLNAGNYSIVVSDGWGCSSTAITFAITQPSEIVTNLSTLQEATCLSPAQIKIIVNGGTPPYKYSTDNVTYTLFTGNNTTFTVGSGTYQYYVTDANNCKLFQTNEIIILPVSTIILQLNQTASVISCAGDNNASVQATATNGLGNYLYSVINSDTMTIIRNPQTSGFFEDLGAGNYIIKVTGDGGCADQDTFTVTEPQPLLVADPLVENIKCFGQKNGKITINASQGTVLYQFGISPNISQISNTNVFENLEPGIYTILIQDANGCFQTITQEITEPDQLAISTLSISQELCEGTNNGSATIRINGGIGPYKVSFNDQTPSSFIQLATGVNQYTTTNLSGGQDYTFYIIDANGCRTDYPISLLPAVDLNPLASIGETCINNIPTNGLTVQIDPIYQNNVEYSINNGLNYQNSNVFSNLAPGNYSVLVRHENGCIKASNTIAVQQLTHVQINAVESGLNQVTATATLGQPPYNYIFNGENTGTNNVYLFSSTGVQNITVIDDWGCEATLRLNTIFYDIEIPNFFTPNGSSINDGWTPLKIDNLKNIKTFVFDRYGRELKILYNGDQWDGTYRGNEVPSGDYWYLVEVNDGSGRTFVGNFTLYR